MTVDSVLQHAPVVVSRLVDGEAVLVHPQQAKIRVLNGVGARVWELMDGRRSLGDISQVIVAEFDIELPCAQSDVLAFCANLVQAGVLAPSV